MGPKGGIPRPVGSLGVGCMVLDTKRSLDIDDMVRQPEALPYYDPASQRYLGDVQAIDRDIDECLEQPRYADQYQINDL